MTVGAAVITRVLVAAGRPSSALPPLTLTVGVETDDGLLHWGDCLVATPDSRAAQSARMLAELSTAALRGQRLESFRGLCALTASFMRDVGDGEIGSAFSSAVQQALLAAISHNNQSHTTNTLITEYNLSEFNRPPSAIPIFIVISDFAASAEQIDAMIALRPAGIGYRLSGSSAREAIGENGEYLQRFVRELTQRVTYVVGQADYKPAFYLGLHGALGQLVDDPLRQIGKILGNCVGLREASGSHMLYLEEPFMLDDATLQPAHLGRLADFMRRSPAMSRHASPPMLVSRVAELSDGNFGLYADLRPIGAAVFDLPISGGIDQLMSRLALLERVGIQPILSFSSSSGRRATRRWQETMLSAALACGSAGLLLSYDHGPAEQYIPALRRISEAAFESEHR